MSEPRLVRIFGEYCVTLPVWGLEDARELISPDLQARLEEWQRRWERAADAALAGDEPIDDGGHHRTEGRALRRALQAELGEGYRVVFPGEGMLEVPDVQPPSEPEAPPRPWWWESRSIAEHNAHGSFHFPPPTLSLEQVLDFWTGVEIPDEVLADLQRAPELQARLSDEGTRRARSAVQDWEDEHPDDGTPEWRTDRAQVGFEAARHGEQVRRVATPYPVDLRSLARAIGLWQATVDLHNLHLGADEPFDSSPVHEFPLPWGDSARTVAQIIAMFPMARFAIRQPGSEAGTPPLEWMAAPPSET